MTRLAVAVSCVGAIVLAAPARAGVSVTGYNCFPLPPGAFELVHHGSEHYSITLKALYAQWADSIYEIRPTASGVVIDNLVVAINGPVAGSPVIIRIYPKCGDESTLIQSVHNIIELGTAETLLNYVKVEHDIGRIEIEAIGDLYCGRDLVGPIVSTTTDNTIRGINAIQAQRHVLGDLIAMQGRVGYVTAHSGDIGAPGQPVLIRAKHDVLKLDARLGNIHADIDTRVSGGQGHLTFLNAGTFEGRLQTVGLKAGLAWNGQITIRDRLGAVISFDRGLASPEFISVPVGGLDGQIIFNAANIPNVDWSGPVHFTNGTTTQFTISGPNYPQPPSLLGGGSLGLAPFGLQGSACLPPVNSVLTTSPCGPPLVRLRFYGPIASLGPAPLSITRRPAGLGGPFSIVALANFTCSITSDHHNTLSVAPAIGAAVSFDPGYEYRITPGPDLVCDAVSGQPPVRDFDYRVVVAAGSDCPGDLDCSGVVNGIDLALLLGAWGPCATCPADLNGSGSVNGLDLGALLGFWGSCGAAKGR